MQELCLCRVLSHECRAQPPQPPCHAECPQGTAAQPSALDGMDGAPQGTYGTATQACPGIRDCLPTAPRASGASPSDPA